MENESVYVNNDGTFRLRDLPTGISMAGARPGTGFIEGIGTVRACLDCGVLVAGGLTRCMDCAQKVGPKFTVESAARKPMRYKIEIRELPAGSVFETDDGAQAVKSEYKLRPNDPDSPTMCIIIGTGEYFHGEGPGVHGDDVQVWPIYIPIASTSWMDKRLGYLRHALQEIVTKSFAWDDSAPGNFELERQRWHKLRNIAMAGLQTIEV